MSEHSTVVGGSSATRVLNCPASVKLAERIPQGPASTYAIEGTALHHCAEQILLSDTRKPQDFLGASVENITITQEMIDDLLTPAMVATEEAFTRFDVEEFEPEATVHFQSIAGAFGTCDIFAKGRDDLIVLLDYKFGRGVMVSPVENNQLMFYAAAAIEDPVFADWWTGDLDQPIAVGIIQPAAERPLQTWETTVRAVVQWTMSLNIAVSQSQKPDLEPLTGDWCRWCPAAPVCPAKKDEAEAMLRLNPEDLDSLSLAMDYADDVEAWAKAVRKMVVDQIQRGDKVDGYKIVNGRKAARKWASDEEAKTKLGNMRGIKIDDYTNRKIMTPTQIEKVCKKKDVDFSKLEVYIGEQAYSKALVTDADPREGIIFNANREIPEHLAKQMTETEK